MDANKSQISPSTFPVDQPAPHERAEYNIQLVLELGQRRILVSFPTDEEASLYFDCVKFTNLCVKRDCHVYLHLTEVNHITLKNRLGIVFNSAAHANEWLLHTRLERCFRQRQKTLWLKEPCGLWGASWAGGDAGLAETRNDSAIWNSVVRHLKTWKFQ